MLTLDITLELFKQYGPTVCLGVLYVWDSRSEKKNLISSLESKNKAHKKEIKDILDMNDRRQESTDKFIREELMALHKESLEVIKDNTEAMNNLISQNDHHISSTHYKPFKESLHT